MNVSPAMFRYSEAKLADRIGVTRGLVKGFRDRVLDPDRDWQKIDGEIALSQRGLKRLWRELRPGVALFDLRDCLLHSLPQKNGAAGIVDGHTDVDPIIPLGDIKMPIPISATVTTVCLNPRVVVATDPHGLRIMVEVGRNANFTVGMNIPVVPKKDAGYWRYTGPMPQRPYTPAEWDRRMKAGFNG